MSLDIDELEALEDQVNGDSTLRAFIEDSLTGIGSPGAADGTEPVVTRTGIEIVALWSLGLATALVLRRLGLFGGSRTAQASDTAEASKKLAEAVTTLTDAGFDRNHAIAATQALYDNAAERAENTELIKALTGHIGG
jgi:hypothetical protein